jgi:hypothetical protein
MLDKALGHGLHWNEAHTQLCLAQTLILVKPMASGFTQHLHVSYPNPEDPFTIRLPI